VIQRTTGRGMFLRPGSLVFTRRLRDREVAPARHAGTALGAAGQP